MPATAPAPTERLVFDRWSEADLPLAMQLWGDADVTKLFDGRGQWSEQLVLERLLNEIKNEQEHGVQYWPLFERTSKSSKNARDGDFAGACGVRWREIQGVRQMELGFHLIPAKWGKGYATEAAKGAIRRIFGDGGVDGNDEPMALELAGGHHPENTASGKVLLKLGFEVVGEELYPPTGLMHPMYRLQFDAVKHK